MILPSFVDKNIELKEKEEKILTVLPINILESVYKFTDMKLQISLLKDDVQILKAKFKYDLKYFQTVSNLNKNLNYILATNLLKYEMNNIKLEVYLYDCLNSKLEIIYDTNLINSSISSLIVEKLIERFNIFMLKNADLSFEKINRKFNLLEFFFDFDSNNYLRKFKLLYSLKEAIKNCENDEDILDILSILKFMKIYNMKKYLEFKNKIYELNVKINDNLTITSIIKEIMEDKWK